MWDVELFVVTCFLCGRFDYSILQLLRDDIVIIVVSVTGSLIVDGSQFHWLVKGGGLTSKAVEFRTIPQGFSRVVLGTPHTRAVDRSQRCLRDQARLYGIACRSPVVMSESRASLSC